MSADKRKGDDNEVLTKKSMFNEKIVASKEILFRDVHNLMNFRPFSYNVELIKNLLF